MKSPKAPAAPDPAATAAAQGQANKDAAIASAEINMIDQMGPYGNIRYQRIGDSGPRYDDIGYQKALSSYDQALKAYYARPQYDDEGRRLENNSQAPSAPKYSDFLIQNTDTPRYQQITELDPSQQRQLDLSNQISEQALRFGQGQLGQVEGALKNPLSFDGLPDIYRDTSADRKRVEDAVYSRMTGRLNDRFGRDQSALESKLANQGLARGSEAFTNAMKDFDYGRNDAYQGAADQAIIAGGQEQNRLFGLDLQGRQQGIQERSLQRSQPVNELATLLGFGGTVQSPQFSSGPGVNISPVDYAGLANQQYQGQINQYNAKNQSNQAAMNGLFGLGQAAVPFLMSDVRSKENINPVGNLSNSAVIYSYNYKGGDQVHIGVMAQEIEQIHPEAVIEIGGLKYVNYARAVQ